MPLLLDTHLLLWSSFRPQRLGLKARRVLQDGAGDICFSSINMVEIAIKQQTRKLEFDVDLKELRSSLLAMSTPELAFTSEHALVLAALPLFHRDPFDRMLVAQAMVSRRSLVTADKMLLAYPADILYVG